MKRLEQALFRQPAHRVPHEPGRNVYCLDQERGELMGFIVNVGLTCFRDWSRAGDYEKCRALSLRLLDLEPFDADLNLMLVQATEQLEGFEAARKTARERITAFHRAQLEAPETVTDYLEARPQPSPQRQHYESLLEVGKLEQALAYVCSLPTAQGEAAQLERRSLQRTLSVRGLAQINHHFEAGQFEAAVHLAETLLERDPASPRLVELLLEALLEHKGSEGARERALELRTFYVQAGLALPRAVERFLPSNVRGG